MPMRAHVGDQLIVESPTTGATKRDGEIVGLHHDDGTPPYEVRWSDTDQVTLVFPGPDAHIHPIGNEPERQDEPERQREGTGTGHRTTTAAHHGARSLSEAVVTALVEDATAAPSMHNAQPWRFQYFRRRRVFHLRADLRGALPHADPELRALHIGCGAALMNLRVAVAHEGWEAQTRPLPDPGDPMLLASVTLTRPLGDEADPAALYPAVRSRHTSRYPFTEREIPASVRTALVDAAHREDVSLSFVSGWHLQHVVDLALEAEARNLTDAGAAADLARYTRGEDDARSATEGVPEYAFGPRRRIGKAPVRDFAGGKTVPGRPTADFETAPHLALLSTSRDRPVDWLHTGQAVERVLLSATLAGLSASFVTQALEWHDLRWPLRDPTSGMAYVQMVLRLGYGPRGTQTPRRPVQDVLDIEP
ncbi:Acg family FMN-binding oxidoreductase [Streptomyces sp. HNM1019]|uniref:Acg family FMN-binding oxidoreductase n=1 Tax=Streptomyces sp. HNM1019 TaxID=3424717 RepID=UPI003D77BA64